MALSIQSVKLVIFASIVLSHALLFDASTADCRVLADCDEGGAQWQQLARGPVGPPGKRGMTGPPGVRGQPGFGVNVTELKLYLEKGDKGPKLHYYVSSLTWQTSKTFCERFDRTLCTFDQICPPKNNGRELIHDVLPGDHWVSVLDSNNRWVEIGDFHKFPCIVHNPNPAWGTTTASLPYKGYVYCCKPQTSTNRKTPDIKYQHIGKSATYASSVAHCEKQGRRLCYSSQVCDSSKPVFGVVRGDNWIAVRDRFNEWIQIGDSLGRTCKTHGILYDLPTWGVREDGSLLDHVGYVYCCASDAGGGD